MILALSAAFCSLAADLEISRPVRSWEFLDAVGPRAGLLGQENGTLEGYIYPLKIFKDLRLRFVSDGQVLPGRDYSIGLVGAKQGNSVVVRMPADASGEYVQQRLTISP